MENSSDFKPDLLSSNTLEVDEQSGSHLKDAGVWAKAIAIIACIAVGLVSLIVLAFSSIFSRSIGFGLPGYAGVLIFFMLVVVGIALIGIINLFRFSSGMATGVNNQDAGAFDRGIGGLKNYFIFIGVLTLLLTFITVIQLIS